MEKQWSFSCPGCFAPREKSPQYSSDVSLSVPIKNTVEFQFYAVPYKRKIKLKV
jgi:hypothetical protein